MPHSVVLPEGLEILVIDDDTPSARLIEAALADQPCRVTSVATAEAALPLLAELRPKLVLVDFALPGMSGTNLARTIKSRPAGRDTIVVLISSRNGPELVQEAVSAGCAACVRKPIDPLALPGMLAGLLKH